MPSRPSLSSIHVSPSSVDIKTPSSCAAPNMAFRFDAKAQKVSVSPGNNSQLNENPLERYSLLRSAKNIVVSLIIIAFQLYPEIKSGFAGWDQLSPPSDENKKYSAVSGLVGSSTAIFLPLISINEYWDTVFGNAESIISQMSPLLVLRKILGGSVIP